jgi:DNA replicative helicase MCM subunit Mcm2 (Cdc46/Mcm family)
MTAEAGAVLQEFYLALRRQYRHSDSIPITTRQFEALVRLVQRERRYGQTGQTDE